MADRWEDVEALLVSVAQLDIEEDVWVRPALVAFAGDHLRFMAWLRPHPKGEYHDPFTELLSLAMPLDADRLAVSISGRAWSLRDPIVPATRDVDLRQRVLIVYTVDGVGRRPRAAAALHPFEVADGGVVWQDRQELPGGEGWIPEVLELSVRERHRLRTTDGMIRSQADRVVRLGHDLHVSAEVAVRLARVEPDPRNTAPFRP
jgi:hypothetical protein